MQRIIKHNTVRRVASQTLASTRATATGQAAAETIEATEANPPAAGPGVKVHRSDGRVHAIEVVCACGETTLIELSYEENPS